MSPSNILTALAVLTVAFLPLLAQRPVSAPRIVSPEVHPDRTITFRLQGPEADAVVLLAPWAGDPKPMTKGADGVWSVTIGPVEPDVLDYRYELNGVKILDPHNPRVKIWEGGAASLVTVPAPKPAFYDVQDVPHGDVHIHWYRSKSVGSLRRVYVYTPPGYAESPGRSYPVLYLLHGSGDNESTWSELGYANLILDNLIAAGEAEPMLVVMPNGHPIPWGERNLGIGGRNTELFRQDLVKDLLPMIESRYRVKKDRAQRAVAGLSMGGGQATHVGLAEAGLFAWIGAFSSAMPDPETDAVTKAFTANPEAANRNTLLFWIAIGKDDFLLDRNETFTAHLKTKGIDHTYKVTEGGHSWPVWRRYLREFAPKLF